MILRLFRSLLETAPKLGAGLDWKTSLQELTAARGWASPSYLVTATGPDHDKEFTATVVVMDTEYGRGIGRTKKEAEQKAAAAAWTALLGQRTSMPELPEVEVVRRGLEAHVAGKTITAVRVHHPRAVRRHEAGPADLTARLLDSASPAPVAAASICGSTLDGEDVALVVHLGMSGQMLLGPVQNEATCASPTLLDDGTALSFVDQRTFGGWMLADLVTVDGSDVPEPVAHIARDPLDPLFDRDARGEGVAAQALRDQAPAARPDRGVGYRQHLRRRGAVAGQGERRAAGVVAEPQAAGELLDARRRGDARRAGQGGTSFDSLYVNVNGESGYFDRSLDAYGREGEPCGRCGAVMRREKFMNRSSFYCPKCQPRPRPSTAPRKRSARDAVAPRSVVVFASTRRGIAVRMEP